MRKSILKVASLTVLVTLGSQTAARAGISGTPHDFANKGWGSTELCIFCHTPHFAQAVTAAPLWNHKSTTASYTLYSSPTFSGASSQSQPDGTSKLCLSCHDGTVAVDSFGVAGVLRSGGVTISSTNTIGGGGTPSLATDHPISFTYDSTLAGSSQSGLATPNSTNWVDAAHTIPLYNGKLQCGSCHEPHNNANTKFLRIANTGSALCIKCHATK